jgi:hypothetical protein
MKMATIPKTIAGGKDDLIVIPRKEYEVLKASRAFPEFMPTRAQKRALLRAERNFKTGKTLSYDELVRAVEA